LAGGAGDAVAVYREELLEQWAPPAEWAAGQGWGAEHLEQTIACLAEQSLVEAAERRGAGRHRPAGQHAELARALRREQRLAGRFEAALERAARDEGGPVDWPSRGVELAAVRGEQEDDWEEEEEEEEEAAAAGARTEFVPVISYMSPSLGRLVSPLKLLTRQEEPMTGRAPARPLPAKRKAEPPSPGWGRKRSAARLPRSRCDG
jgi:hypothetical protein